MGTVVGGILLLSAVTLAATVIQVRKRRRMQHSGGLSEQQLRSFTESMPRVRFCSLETYLPVCMPVSGKQPMRLVIFTTHVKLAHKHLV